MSGGPPGGDAGQGTSVEIRRVLPAPPDEVFRAWTEPETVREWMSPVGSAEAVLDVRVGGRFRITMVGAGAAIEHTGEYVEVQPPRRLSFTWVSPYTGKEPSLVTVDLSPHADGTELVLTHERLSADVAPSHREGWGVMLERLAGRLEAEEGR